MKKYKIKEIQDLFAVTRGTVYNWHKDGRLNIIKEGKKTFVILGEELIDKLAFDIDKTATLKDYALKQNINVYKSKYAKSEEQLAKTKSELIESKEQVERLKSELVSIANVREVYTKILSLDRKLTMIEEKVDKLSSILKTFIEELEKDKSNSLFKKLFS